MISLIFGIPLWANAGFLSDLTTMVLGTEVTATEIPTIENNNDNIHNSQTIPLLESSINPDLKNINKEDNTTIIQNGSFIYSDSSFGTDVKVEKSPLSNKINIYTVKKGDTLSEIAELFDISTNTIRWENNISGQKISIGQKLNILPVTGVKHIVKRGDTIEGIANKHDAITKDILIFNGLSKKDIIRVRDIIFVPNGIIKSNITKSRTFASSSKKIYSNTKIQTGYYLRPVSGRIKIGRASCRERV